MQATDLSGIWRSRYSYHSSDGPATSSDHVIELTAQGDMLIGRSQAQTDGSVVMLELKFDAANRVLTGSWSETTSPLGSYKGAIFHGALQLLVEEKGRQATGQWVGFNSSHSRVKNGEWSLTRQ